jgi:hypothetical protein
VRATPILAACVLLAVPLVGCAGSSPSELPTGPIAFETIEKGQDSSLAERKTLVIRNDTAWTNLWTLHAPETNDDSEPPKVDFSRKTVLAVFGGQDHDTCRGAQVTNVTGLSDGTIQANWTLTPLDGDGCPERNASAFHLVEIDRYDAEVAFSLEGPADGEESRPLTAKPPACWRIQTWEQPGLYESAHEADGEPGTRRAERSTGAGLPFEFEHADLPLDPGRIELATIRHVAPSGNPYQFLGITLEAASEENHTHLRALTWSGDTPEEAEALARAFLANTTSASERRIADWASQFKRSQHETDEFPPTRPAVDRPEGAESDGYAYNLTIDAEDALELGSLAETLDEEWRRIDGDPRPRLLLWMWDVNWTGAATHWTFSFRVPTLVLATDVNGTTLVVEISATDEVFLYAAEEPETSVEAWTRQGFEELGLPEPAVDDLSHGARVC